MIQILEEFSDGGGVIQYPCSCKVTVKDVVGCVKRAKPLCRLCALNKVLVERNTTHGKHGSPEHHSWSMMRRRCDEPSNNRYYAYGGRGITYDPRWIDFSSFYEDMGDRPEGTSLDRIDVNGNYCKENCVWSDVITQANNKTNNIIIKNVDTGEVFSLRRWCEILGLGYKSVFANLKYSKKPRSISENLGGNFEFVQLNW